MPYTLRQRLSNYVKPDTDPYMGLPYSRTWTFLTDAYIAYDNRRYGGPGQDRGTRDPLVVMARLWVVVAERVHVKWGHSQPYKHAVVAKRNAVCVHCGETDMDTLIRNHACIDCHMELNA
jgi:hypothetical protein